MYPEPKLRRYRGIKKVTKRNMWHIIDNASRYEVSLVIFATIMALQQLRKQKRK